MSNDQRFSNIWDAIEDTTVAAASMQARSTLMMAIQVCVKAGRRTQAEVAHLLGITQPRMSDLMRGKINLFSLDALMDMATLAGLQPQVKVNSVIADFNETDQHLVEEIGGSAGNAVVGEVRPQGDDERKFVVPTKSSSTQATSRKAHLKVVPFRRTA